MGSFKVFTLVLLLLGSISLPASQAQFTPDENDAPDPDPVTPVSDPTTVAGPPTTTVSGPPTTNTPPTTNNPEGLTCVTANYALGLKLNQDVGLSLRFFGNKVWIEGVDYSSGYPDPSTPGDVTPGSGSNPDTTAPTPPPPPQGGTPDDRK